MKSMEGELNARTARFGIAVARFNSLITERLHDAAVKTLLRHGADAANVDTVWVPGAFELPLAAKRLASTGRYNAVVALGCVIRGGTPHFDYVAGECASGLSRVSLDLDIPVSFGVLTVDTIEQAIERAGTKAGNKGEDAALSALEMVNVLKQIAS
ncbi:6,7-dimethyl-8-ribityllumazine synthase [Pseudomonadota bacterium]